MFKGEITMSLFLFWKGFLQNCKSEICYRSDVVWRRMPNNSRAN